MVGARDNTNIAASETSGRWKRRCDDMRRCKRGDIAAPEPTSALGQQRLCDVDAGGDCTVEPSVW